MCQVKKKNEDLPEFRIMLMQQYKDLKNMQKRAKRDLLQQLQYVNK